MAITRPILAGDGIHPIEVNAPWAVNFHSADVTVAGVSQELKAAPARAGSALSVTHVTMGIVGNAKAGEGYLIDNKITLEDGDGTVLFGPIQMQAEDENGGIGGCVFSKDWPKDAPLKLTDNKALNGAIAREAGTYNTAALIYVEGFTGDKPLG